MGESPAKTASYELAIKNATIQNSSGFTRTDEPAYTQLPAASPKPAAPIDPSSMYPCNTVIALANHSTSSFEVVLYLVCSGLAGSSWNDLSLNMYITMASSERQRPTIDERARETKRADSSATEGSRSMCLYGDLVVLLTLDRPADHGRLHVLEELIAVLAELLCSLCEAMTQSGQSHDHMKRRAEQTFVKRVVRVRLQEQILQADHHGVEVQDRFPVLTKDVQTDIALQVDVWVVYLAKGTKISLSEEHGQNGSPSACT
jgi:hypothetical protein